METKRKKGNTVYGEFAKADRAANSILPSSRQLDEFVYGQDIIQPPYEPKDLIALVEREPTLKQNIEAMASNVAHFGHGVKYRDNFDFSKAGESEKTQSEQEWLALERLYNQVHPLEDFSTLIYQAAVDMYTFGWGMIEVIRGFVDKNIKSMEYCRACNYRIANNAGYSTALVKVWEETETGYTQVDNYIKFKKFVQIINDKKIYFKELGDPRQLNRSTGQYSENVPPDEQATEIAYFSVHSSYSDYGVPYWINTAVTASGIIMSELLNYKYFKDGRILPMAITVSGGNLTESSVKAINEGKGIENAYKILLLEAAPFEDANKLEGFMDGATPRVNVDVKSLTDTNNKDSLFREYQRDGREKIRDSLRLPPIYTGATTDYNRSTAETAREMAEEQIFVPERKRITGVFNKVVNNERGIRYVELYLKAPDMSTVEQKAKILTTLDNAGAVTPNMLIPLVEEVLGKDIEFWNEEWGNIPFALLKQMRQFRDDPNLPVITVDDSIVKSDKIIDDLSRLIDAIEKGVE